MVRAGGVFIQVTPDAEVVMTAGVL